MKYVCKTEKDVSLKENGLDMIVEANTPGEARSKFKKVHGMKPDHATGTRKRLPVGYRVREAK